MPTLQEVIDGQVAKGGDVDKVRASIQAKYGVDPKLLDPKTDYNLIKQAGPKLAGLLKPMTDNLAGLSTPKPETEQQKALRAGAASDYDFTDKYGNTPEEQLNPPKERLTGGPFDPIGHAQRLWDVARGAANAFYPEQELQIAENQRGPSQLSRVADARKALNLPEYLDKALPTNKQIKQEIFQPKAKPSAVEEAWHGLRKQRHERYEASKLMAPIQDVGDVLSGLVDMASKAILPEWVPVDPNEGKKLTPEEQAKADLEYRITGQVGDKNASRINEEWGKNLAGSLTGGLARSITDIGQHPIETLVTAPLSTALAVSPVVTPLAKGAYGKYKARHGAKAPHVEPAFPTEVVPTDPTAAKVEKVRGESDAYSDDLLNELGPSGFANSTAADRNGGRPPPTLVPPDRVPHLTNTVFGDPSVQSKWAKVSTLLDSAGQGWSNIKQILADGLRQNDPRATAMLDELVRDPERTKSYINSMGPAVAEMLGNPEAATEFRDSAKWYEDVKKKMGDEDYEPAPIQPHQIPVESYPRAGEVAAVPERAVPPVELAHWDDILAYLSEDHPVKEQINKIANGIIDLVKPTEVGAERGIMDAVQYRLGSLLRDKAPALLRDEATRGKVVDAILADERRAAGDNASAVDWKALRKNLDNALLTVVTESKAATSRGLSVPGMKTPVSATMEEALAHPDMLPEEQPLPDSHPHAGKSREMALKAQVDDLNKQLQDKIATARGDEATEVQGLRDNLDSSLAEMDRQTVLALEQPLTDVQIRSVKSKAAMARRNLAAKVEEQVQRIYSRTRQLEDKLTSMFGKSTQRAHENFHDQAVEWEAERQAHAEKLRQRLSDERLDEHGKAVRTYTGGVEYEPNVQTREPYAPGSDKSPVAPVSDYLTKVMQAMDPEEASRVRAEVAKAVVSDLAGGAAKEALRNGLAKEASRSIQGIGDVSDAVSEMVSEPNGLHAGDPVGAREAAVRGAIKSEWANKWAQHILNGGLDPQAIPSKIQGVAVTPIDFANALRDVAAKMQDLPKQAKIMRAAKFLAEYQKVDPEFVPFDGYTAPRFAKALEWDARSQKGVGGVVGAINSWVAANQVGRSPSAIVNNTISNLGMLALKYGRPAGPGLLKELGTDILDFGNYLKKGVDDNPFYEAYRKSGSMDSDRITQNIGADAASIPGTKGINDFMANTYKTFGDQMFKLWSAKQEWGRWNGYLSDLSPGEFVDVPMNPRKTAHVVSKGNGIFDVYGLESTGTAPKQMTLAGLQNEVLPQAITMPGNSIFLDYAEKGNYPKMMRGTHAPLVPILSQYYSYIYGALDIPGVKKGMVSGIVSDPGAVVTNSNKILGHSILAGGDLAMRRAMVVNGLKQDLAKRNNDDLMRVFKWAPSDLKIGIATALTEPDTVSILDLSNANALDGSVKMYQTMAMIGRAFAKDPTQFRNLDPKDKKGLEALARIYGGEASASAADVLQIAGLGGSFIGQVHKKMMESENAGKDMDVSDYWDLLSGPVVGPLPAKLISGVTSGVVEAAGTYPSPSDNAIQRLAKAPYAYRERALGRDPFATWLGSFVRQMTSVGWDTRVVRDLQHPGQADRFFEGLKKNYLKAFDVPAAEHFAESLDVRTEHMTREEAKKLRQSSRKLENEADVYRSVIEDTIDDMQDEFDKVMDKVVRNRSGKN